MPDSAINQVIRFGAFEVDPRAGELRKNGLRIRLQEQPFQILLALVGKPGEVITREELRAKLWPADTFVDFDHGLNAAINRLRDALGDSAEAPRFVETLARRGYRFIGTVKKPLAATNAAANENLAGGEQRGIKWRIVVPVAVAVVALATGSYFFSHRAPNLTDRDTIVLADFVNTTGDPVFDGTLRQGLAVQLEQSPFLSLVSDVQIQQTMRMMKQRPDAGLTTEIAREICQRTSSAAVLDGAIAQIGTQYSLILKVTNCASGELVATTEAQASDKSHVLDALGRAASQIRNKLGESLNTIEKLTTPLEQATTSSLAALQAYTLGRKQAERGAPTDAIPFLKRAIELDPNFALAYAGLSILYSNTDSDMGAQYATKAFELRNHVSERERLYITTVYYETVTGELDKTIETLKVMEQTYNRDAWARSHLGSAYEREGELTQAAEEYRTAISLDSHRVRARYNLGAVLLLLGHLDESKGILEDAIAKKADDMDVHLGLYQIAYVKRDATGMQREVEWAAGKPDEFRMILEQSAFALHRGKLKRPESLWAERTTLPSDETWIERSPGGQHLGWRYTAHSLATAMEYEKTWHPRRPLHLTFRCWLTRPHWRCAATPEGHKS